MADQLVPGGAQRSEFSFGKGHFPHPESNFQDRLIAEINMPVSEDQMSNIRRFMADRRTDPTDANSGGYDDMIFEKGNPDQFGPQPPLVKEGVVRPAKAFPQPQYRTGVDRAE